MLTLIASVRNGPRVSHECKAADLVACSFEPKKKDLMTSRIISRAACLRELASNPKSFSNCPDLHGGVPELARDRIRLKRAVRKKKSARRQLRGASAKIRLRACLACGFARVADRGESGNLF